MRQQGKYDTSRLPEAQFEPGSRRKVLKNLRDITSKREMDEAARMLAVLMALQAGLPLLDFSGIRGNKKKEYFAAVQVGMDQNYEPMTKFLSR